MNHEPPAAPVEFCIRRTLCDIKSYARREPVKAVAAALGVGLLINLLPTRVLASTVNVVGAALVRPILISLGVTKAMELCCSKSQSTTPITLDL